MKIRGMKITPITLEWKKTIGESFGEVGKREDDVIFRYLSITARTALLRRAVGVPIGGCESPVTRQDIIHNSYHKKRRQLIPEF